jgi:hypothetical protein
MFARSLAIAGLIALASGVGQAQTEYPATLAGHALLPAQTFIDPPADAPEDLRTSGKFTDGLVRNDRIGSFEGRSGGRPTGVFLPFRGQPVQGHSGVKRMPDGTFWVLTDNGFGTKANSPDAALFLSHYRIDWTSGRIERLNTVFLHDPDRKVPFRIVHEGSARRYLTGADFDLEGFQIIKGKLWIGDEFGPYLIRASMDGRVEAVFETMADGKPVMSPDHFRIVAPNPGQTLPTSVNLGRSRGYEGLAASPDGRFLYGLLEGPLWDHAARDWEKHDGQQVLRILEFSVADEKWTGRHWKYVLSPGATAIGDFNMIDETTALVIERDNGEGTTDRACADSKPAPACFHDLARFKRVVKLEMSAANVNGPIRKIGYVDLMKIRDPQRRARKPLNDGVLRFPFFTIENVDIVDERHIIVGNDNNLPFSSSRDPNRADDNEFILLEVEALLRAR